jgi:phosphohistidine phosphatase
MRHGPAEDDAPSGRDFDRRLTSRGRERTERVARALARRAEAPSRIVCSPLVRTVETAEVVRQTLALVAHLERCNELAPGGDALTLAIEWAREPGPLLVVGHEPDLTLLTSRLAPGWSGRFEKSMVVGLTLPAVLESADVAARLEAQVDFTIDPKRPDN